MDIPWITDTLFLSNQGNHFMKWWTPIISNKIHHSREATLLIHIMTKQTSSKTRLPHQLTWNIQKHDQSQTKTIPKKNHMPTKNQTTFPTHRLNKKNVASYYKIVTSTFQSYCNNPKPTPKTEFVSTRKKNYQLTEKTKLAPKESISKQDKSRNDTSTLQSLHDIPDIFPAALYKNTHRKQTFNASLNAKLTALQDIVTRIHRLDFANFKNSEKNLTINITMQCTIFSNFSLLKNSLQKDIENVIGCTI